MPSPFLGLVKRSIRLRGYSLRFVAPVFRSARVDQQVQAATIWQPHCLPLRFAFLIAVLVGAIGGGICL